MSAPAFNVHAGMSLDEAVYVAKQTGCGVEIRHRTGELTVRIPGRPPIQVNSRRKDVARALTSALRRHVNSLAA